ncbi:MAG: Flp pilus assembly complex ATPase component TadA [Phycisphaerae bacterium]|nr:Flp pilus assembly complex ATPase component TadA [Phycisphaerae bacterium]MCZ2398920.1 Flp pilus assembly complex ATPase component TadA [Phycisphaerae bacterium]NUQ48903.1 Flp pilus assembly complex ATPase component TadA [Phycisphaerae bacterium]
MPVGEALVARGLITDVQLAEALRAQKSSSERIDQVLIRSGLVSERDMLAVYSEQFAIPVVELTERDIDTELLRLVPSRLVHKYGLIPVSRNGKGIRVATSDPYNMYALDEVRTCIDMPVEPVLATRGEIHKLIKAFYGVGGEVLTEMVADDEVQILDEARFDSADLDVQMAQEASVVKLVNEILIEAIDQRASDIHFEPYENDFSVRYRIDGLLHHANVPPEIRRFQNAVVSRIKILSGLNIAEKRLPQDGGIKIKVHGREVDLRVSVIPMAFGEGVVLRILDRTAIRLSLPDLGMEGDTYERFKDLINRPHGILLVTGPTGSGKTTSLYAALSEIVSEDIKILTVEDPIEYYLEGINQVQVLPKIGLDFARALRSFLRHDPDVILVGEIRDRETAEVAINASLTGHLVFSTLHTNDAVSATTRLLDMGVEPFLISSSVEAVMAQRLVRTICEKCKTQYTPESVTHFPKDFEYKSGEKLWRGAGCRECRNSGYAGRRAIFELLVLDDELRELIVQRKSAAQMLPVARKNGLRLLREDGWRLVRRGLTTPEEVVRATKV